MKQPYFPDPTKPKEASPYREPQPKASPPADAPAVVVSRPEPVAEEPIEPTRAPLPKSVSSEVSQLEARALLAVDRNRNVQYFRTRILVVPITLALWRYGRGLVGWLVYPLLAVSLVLVVLEIKRIWRRTEL